MKMPDAVAHKEVIHAVTASNQLIRFNAAQPDIIISAKPILGLQAGEKLVGIDYRIAKGMLYGIGSTGRLYQIDPAMATARLVGSGPFPVALSGTEIGIDFNPTVDRIRVVSNLGLNMRLHPDTGAVIDSDPVLNGIQTDGPLAYTMGDVNHGKVPSLVAAAYTYNKTNEKLTTNFAIDGKYGALVTQGSREGVVPAVSPNTGQLQSVGPLGIDRFEQASFDIADVSGTAFIAATTVGKKRSEFYQINLATGKAALIGRIGVDDVIVGMAIEP
ncbi:MAG: DUF4394 domain-containing protein [Pseudomonadota bacterium]